MLFALAAKIFGTSNDRSLKSLYKHIEPINALEAVYEKMNDDELKGQTEILRKRLADGETLDDLINDAWKFETCFAAFDLRLEETTIEVVQLFVENPNKPDVLAACVLEMRQPRDHLLTVKAVSTARIWFACLVAERLRLAFAPLEAQTSGHGD